MSIRYLFTHMGTYTENSMCFHEIILPNYRMLYGEVDNLEHFIYSTYSLPPMDCLRLCARFKHAMINRCVSLPGNLVIAIG